MIRTAVLGFPRMGKNRELKKALEQYWQGAISQESLLGTAKTLRAAHWQLMKAQEVDIIPSNDFSLYDQVLDTSCMVGAVPERYAWAGGEVNLELFFAMARGRENGAHNIAAMEMTKWFDTNYHYLVPEFKRDQLFELCSLKAVREFTEAKALGIHTRPVLLGPLTYLRLGRMADGQGSTLDLLPRVLPVYETMLARLAEAGADWVQMDEPLLVLDRDATTAALLVKTYQALSKVDGRLNIQLATYFGGVTQYLDELARCPVSGWHIDLVRAPEQLEEVLGRLKPGQQLSLGLINGRNVWRSDITGMLPMLQKAVAKQGGENLLISPSCSLVHVPLSLTDEVSLDPEMRGWLSFAEEKLGELKLLQRFINEGRPAVADALTKHQVHVQFRRASPKVHRAPVKERIRQLDSSMFARTTAFSLRKCQQQKTLGLPVLPTTTIGSFPQTAEVRRQRNDFKQGKISLPEYEAFLQEETKKCVAVQEELGLDVLVHGEFERNDMVEYFGEQLEGFVFTHNGWVQSYGSRCVKPPIIYGDVERKAPMTVAWSRFAQSLTGRPMKGMLTGPVTILEWSFVRDDQPRKDTCQQIALAIRDEVHDLEQAGIGVIQIDEPALREGLPLKKTDWPEYLRWSVDCFRLSAAGVRDETQIHTHMCYGDFEDILPAIAELDADVISIEASRSDMVLLKAFGDFKYPNDIGPGVYDIHSPLVPSVEAIVEIMEKAMQVIPAAQLWINPDCGLKTREWPEVAKALKNMTAAANQLRMKLTERREQVHTAQQKNDRAKP